MSKKKVIIIIAVIAILFLGSLAKKFLVIDSCLDRGGRWDYENKKCVEYEKVLEVNKCLNYGGRWDYEQEECKTMPSNID